MKQTFFFYDLETSGISPRTARVMQFAGQRTTLDLKPIGEPFNILITLSPDVLPEPGAILVTGITPQKTIAEGITEAAFLRTFFEEVATPGTIFVGYNTVRFDDEFMRFMLYRNFYDPYEWQWKDGRSRWDLLDVVRMTRALRPDGIQWPFDAKGAPTNRLELLTDINGLDHREAHDALSDVKATIALATLLRNKQPKLFDYLLTMREKHKVQEMVTKGEPFVYSSGKYSSDYQKTTVVDVVSEHPKRQAALVYDLRHDPMQFINMNVAELVEAWRWSADKDKVRLPVKTLRYNVCPAIAPIGVLKDAPKSLAINMDAIKKHMHILRGADTFKQNLLKALDVLDAKQDELFSSNRGSVDEQLYDGFIGDHDKTIESVVRAAPASDIAEVAKKFRDVRLQQLAPLYKARNYPKDLTDNERKEWEKHLQYTLLSGGSQSRLAKYFASLQQAANNPNVSQNDQYILEELQLYGQSIMPEFDEPATSDMQ